MKTVIAKENTDKFVIGGLLKVGSILNLLLPEGGDLRYYRLLVSFISSLMTIKEDIKPYHSYDKPPP